MRLQGCCYEETIAIRIPKTLKGDVLEIAHKLDAGETIDLVTESSNDKILLLQEENQELKYQLETLQKSFDSLYEITQKKQNESDSNNLKDENTTNKLLEKDIEKYIVYRSKIYEGIDNVTVILKVSQIAKRLSVAERTISNYVYQKSESDFIAWTKKKDPDNISWKLLSKKFGYVPAVNLTSQQEEKLNDWIENTLLKSK